MKILWFPRLQFDIDKFHIRTWKEMCDEIEAQGHMIEIAIGGKRDLSIFERDCINVPIIKLKGLRLLSYWVNGFILFNKKYFEYRPDAVILHLLTIWFSLPLLLIPRNKRGRIIVDIRTPLYNLGNKQTRFRDNIFKIYSRICFWYCKKFLSGVTVITSYFKDKICKEYQLDPDKVGVWSSGVNLSEFSSRKYILSPRPKELKDKFFIMQHGEISYNRGILETVKSLSLIKNDDICLLLVGDSINKNKAREDAVKLAQELDIEKQILIIPPVTHKEVPKYISYCDCAIMAYPLIDYWNYNNPIKLLEYLAMKKVVICPETWTFKNVIGIKKCGCFIKNNSPQAIAAGIQYCYKNRDLLYGWGSIGLKIVKEKYTWKQQALKLINFIENLR